MTSYHDEQLWQLSRENAVNREAIEQQDAMLLHQQDELTQLHAHVAEQADYIATLEASVVELQRDLERAHADIDTWREQIGIHNRLLQRLPLRAPTEPLP